MKASLHTKVDKRKTSVMVYSLTGHIGTPSIFLSIIRCVGTQVVAVILLFILMPSQISSLFVLNWLFSRMTVIDLVLKITSPVEFLYAHLAMHRLNCQCSCLNCARVFHLLHMVFEHN